MLKLAIVWRVAKRKVRSHVDCVTITLHALHYYNFGNTKHWRGKNKWQDWLKINKIGPLGDRQQKRQEYSLSGGQRFAVPFYIL